MKSSLYAGIGVLAAALGAIALLLNSASPTVQAARSTATKTLTVYGNSTTMATPNVAQITVGVTNQASTAHVALTQNNTILDRVVHRVESLGIQKSSIQTTGLNINPNYNQANPPSITGYQVDDNATVNAPMAKAGQVIDTAVAAGANQVNGINWITSEPSAYRQTFRAALQDAKNQALAMASAMGDKGVSVVSVTVQPGGQSSPAYFGSVKAAATPAYPGQQEENVTLKVVYRVNS